MVCVHNRRTDFIERNVATDVNKTVLAANTVALKMVWFASTSALLQDNGAVRRTILRPIAL